MSYKTCETCKFAEWRRTANGRRHPSGEGRCKWEMPRIVLPVAFWYFDHQRSTTGPAYVPAPLGGIINKSHLRECRAWESK